MNNREFLDKELIKVNKKIGVFPYQLEDLKQDRLKSLMNLDEQDYYIIIDRKHYILEVHFVDNEIDYILQTLEEYKQYFIDMQEYKERIKKLREERKI